MTADPADLVSFADVHRVAAQEVLLGMPSSTRSKPWFLLRYVLYMASPLPEGTVTFLLTDIEGSTGRWVEGPGMSSALAEHDEAIRTAVEANRGHWVKHTGDGVLAVFDQASRAVNAAVQIQQSLEQNPGRGLIKVRIGLNTGEAERRADDYFGLAVSATARVMEAAHGGQVLVSEATRVVLAPSAKPDIELIDLGVHRLKDLSEPWE